MELVDIIQELWRRRWWLLAGLVVAGFVAVTTAYDVRYGVPPELEKKVLTVGVASTQLLIDAPESPIADLAQPFDPLVSRADIYAKLIASAPVREAIGRELGVPGSSIVTLGPSVVNENTGGRAVGPATRSAEIVAEGRGLRLSTGSLQDQPITTITAQGPTAEIAVKLADAAGTSLKSYVEDLQVRQRVPLARRVQITPLGTAQGGLTNAGIDRSVMVLAFLGIFVTWCVAVLLGAGLVNGIRQARAIARHGGEVEPDGGPAVPQPASNGNGNGLASPPVSAGPQEPLSRSA